MALVVTEGFGDLLHIGNQSRPHIFDLEIRWGKGHVGPCLRMRGTCSQQACMVAHGCCGASLWPMPAGKWGCHAGDRRRARWLIAGC